MTLAAFYAFMWSLWLEYLYLNMILAKENIKSSIHNFQLCFSMEESKKKNQSWLLGKIFVSQARKEGVVCSIYSGALGILTNLGRLNMASGLWKSILRNEKEISLFFAASSREGKGAY